MSVIACKHMQIYAKDSQLCVPKVPNSPQTCKARRFVYFQIIGKPINGTKEIDTLMLYVQIWGICVCACVCVFLHFFVKSFGQDFKFICSNLYGRLNASTKFPFASESPPRVRGESSCTILHNESDFFQHLRPFLVC